MTLLKALFYFFREAALNMARGWRVSLLAVLTIAVSLFVGGVFLLVSGNLAQVVESWRSEARIVVYMKNAASAEDQARTHDEAAKGPAVTDVKTIDAAAARQHFRELFPSLGDLVEGWSEDPLPPSLEIAFDPTRSDNGAFEAWTARLRALPAVAMVDDDRDWLRQLENLIAVVRGVGLALGAVLLGAAMFTIGSVIRLTAYLYSEEIGILRLVGGTEFYIRGPFYVEGLLQGLVGSMLAVGGLAATFAFVRPQAPSSVLAWIVARAFLPWRVVLFLLVLGAAAGLIGAVMSLRREALGALEE
ncbi:MAG: ABC transporter permease [Acidobacteriota bacterium]